MSRFGRRASRRASRAVYRTVGGHSDAAGLRSCADGDGDGEVSSEEAGNMITDCMSYKGAPPLSETAMSALRSLARC